MEQVDGWSVNRVTIARDGQIVSGMQQTDRRGWVEEDLDTGEDLDRWVETGRDDWSVYLHHPASERRRQIDLHTRLVTTRLGAEDLAVDDLREAIAQVNGWSAALVVVGRNGVPSARFHRIGEGRWARYPVGAKAAELEYRETRRDDWSVFLRAEGDDGEMALDLHARRVLTIRPGADWKAGDEILDADTALPGSEPGDLRRASLTFRNDGHATAEILWLDVVGREFTRGVIEPGETLDVDTHLGHAWVAREVFSRRRLKMTVVTNDHEVVAVDTRELASTVGSPVAVTFKSLYPRLVRLMWVGPDREEHELASVRGRAHISLTGSSGDVIRCYHGNREIEVFVLGIEPRQYREITRGPARRPDTSITFRNASPLHVRLMQVEGGKERRYRTLAPGEEVVQPAVAGEMWRTRERASRRLIGELHAETLHITHTVTTSALRSTPTERASRVTMHNRTVLVGVLVRVDEDGHEQRIRRLRPGKRVTIDAHEGDAWRLRELWTRRELGFAIANRRARCSVSFELPAAHSRTPASLTIRNSTLLTTELSWIDGDGRERPEATLPPMGAMRFRTALSHTWVVRERRSGVVLDFATVHSHGQELSIDRADLTRLENGGPGGTAVVTFGNEMGFAFEVCRADDPTGDPVRIASPGEEVTLETTPGAAFVMREPTSRGVFDGYMCGGRSDQGYAVQQRSKDSGMPTTIEFANETPFDVDVSQIDPEGVEHPRAAIAPGGTHVQASSSGQLWAVKERRSGQVLGYTQGFGSRQRLRVTMDRVMSRPADHPTQLTFHNTTSMSLDLWWVDYAGAEHYHGTIAPGDAFEQSTYAATVWRLVRSGTETEIDAVMAGLDETVQIRNGLVRTHPGEPPSLRPGEVALFGGEHHTGGSSVVSGNIDDTSAVVGTSVVSLRLGVGTGIIAYREPGYTGDTDVFHADVASLANTDVGAGFASFEIFTVAAPTKQLRRSGSDRVRDHRLDANGNLEEFSSYRTVLEFVEEVDAVVVRATEELDVEVAGITYTMYPDLDTILEPNIAGTVMLTSEAIGIGAPALMVRTNTMAPSSWFFVYPDAASMTRLQTLPDSAIWDNRDQLAVPEDLQNEDLCRNVMQAVRQLATAVPDPGPTARVHHKLEVDRMEMPAWSLDLRGGAFTPLTPDEAAAAPVGVVREDLVSQFNLGGFISSAANVVVRPVRKAATAAVTAVQHHVVEPTVTEIDRAARTVDREVIQPAATFIQEEIVEPVAEAVEMAVAEVERVVDQAGEIVSDIAEDVVEAVDQVVDDVRRTAEVVLAVTAEVAGKVETVILDTAEKVGTAVTEIVEAVVEAVEEFVKMIERLFDWHAILRTHDVLVGAITSLIDRGPERFEEARRTIRNGLRDMRDATDEGLQGLRDQMGIPGPEPYDDESTADGESDWIMSRLLEWLDGAPDLPGAGSSVDAPAVARFQDAAAPVLQGVFDRAGSIAGRIWNELDAMVSAPPAQLPARAMGLVITLIEEFADLAFDVVDALIDALVDLLIALFDVVRPLLLAPLDIPVISELYESLVHRKLSITSLLALMVAAPANVLGALTLGDEFRPGRDILAAQTDDSAVRTRRALGAAARIVRAPIATIAVAVDDRARFPRHNLRRRTARKQTWSKRQYVAATVLLFDDVLMGLAHFCDFPASTGFDRAESRLSRGVQIGYHFAWFGASLAIGSGLLGSAISLTTGSEAAADVKDASDVFAVVPIAVGIITSVVALVEDPSAGAGTDVLVAIVQGATDLEAALGVIGGSSVIDERLALNSVGNLATGGLFIARNLV